MMQHTVIRDITPPTGDSLHSTTPTVDACSSLRFVTVLKRPFSKSTNVTFAVLHEEQDDVTLPAEF